jgi:recombinational DNA repair protein (RecF pathway)
MHEYVTKAFILSTEPAGEANLRVTMFTQSSGKVVALARSARKPKAKLTAHLQPLSISRVRLVERKGVQVVDAMKISTSNEYTSMSADWASRMIALLGVAQLIDKMTDLYHPDPELWALIESGSLASASTLKILGFDPAHARCRDCNTSNPSHFLIKDAEYLCNSCFTPSAKSANKERVVVQ